jgi:hypothetical protein
MALQHAKPGQAIHPGQFVLLAGRVGHAVRALEDASLLLTLQTARGLVGRRIIHLTSCRSRAH